METCLIPAMPPPYSFSSSLLPNSIFCHQSLICLAQVNEKKKYQPHHWVTVLYELPHWLFTTKQKTYAKENVAFYATKQVTGLIKPYFDFFYAVFNLSTKSSSRKRSVALLGPVESDTFSFSHCRRLTLLIYQTVWCCILPDLLVGRSSVCQYERAPSCQLNGHNKFCRRRLKKIHHISSPESHRTLLKG